MIDLLTQLILSLQGNLAGIITIGFLLSLIGGEPVILAISFIATAQGLASFLQLLAIAYSTAIIGESLLFFLARIKWFPSLNKKFSESKLQGHIHHSLGKLENGKPMRLLFLSRLVSGLTVIVIIYLSRSGISFKKFFRYCLIINGFWSPLVVLAGWSAGKGFAFLLHTFENVHLVLNISFLFLIAGYVIYRILKRNILEEK